MTPLEYTHDELQRIVAEITASLPSQWPADTWILQLPKHQLVDLTILLLTSPVPFVRIITMAYFLGVYSVKVSHKMYPEMSIDELLKAPDYPPDVAAKLTESWRAR